ncbi:hypothetical protein [Streptomyces sp. SCL15-4]|uniref:hypothetical protein n=1 Tax=Streptomyces sp. SCL15-4 TaxID=2967221 RepID=UPI0029671901|nr:hypothetical protein [Streptomyces sp. SCL15-4]
MSAVRQLDQLPPDATTLARKVAELERQVKELRAARRLTAATIGTMRTATTGSRVEISQESQAVQIYAQDGETLLAELGPEETGGGGLWTRGLQTPNNIAASLTSGQLQFQPAEQGLVAVPAGITYDSDAYQYTDLILTSGNVAPTAHRAIMTLESTFEGGSPYVYVQGENSTQCNLDILGVLTASNIAYGQVSITPSAANTPTSVTVTGLGLKGTTFYGLATANTVVPGSQVTGVGVSNASSNGMTIWATRTTTTATNVNWMVIGI